MCTRNCKYREAQAREAGGAEYICRYHAHCNVTRTRVLRDHLKSRGVDPDSRESRKYIFMMLRGENCAFFEEKDGIPKRHKNPDGCKGEAPPPPKLPRNCLQCGKDISDRMASALYCKDCAKKRRAESSRESGMKFRAQQRAKKPPVFCTVCGAEIQGAERHRRFCDECRRKRNNEAARNRERERRSRRAEKNQAENQERKDAP